MAESAKALDNVKQDENITQGVAIAALLLNVLVLPGLGSLIGGRTREGVIQIILVVIAFILALTIIGLIVAIPLSIGAWIWALITGIDLVKKAK